MRDSVIVYFRKLAFSFAPKVTQITSDSMFYISNLSTTVFSDREDLIVTMATKILKIRPSL